ncbi:MAG: MFS transporter [Actinomycetota bacterium]|nr:MAG: MFS transporter [Actinomycetota bacterium]
MATRREGDQRARVAVLALGTFALGTEIFAVSAILPLIAAGLDVSVPTAGLVVAASSLLYALAAPLLGALTRGYERRRVLLGGLTVFVAGSTAAAFAPTLVVLIVLRCVAVLGAATYTPTAYVTAVALSPPQRRGRALSWVLGGIVSASLVGVPLATVLARTVGFRSVFVLVAGLAALAIVAVVLVVPRVAPLPVHSQAGRFQAARDRRVLLVVFVSLLASTATNLVYTYVAPITEHAFGAIGAGLTLVVFVYGVFSTVGTFASGSLVDRFGAGPVLLIGFVMLGVSVVVLPVAGSWAVGLVCVACWAAFGSMVIPAQQTRLLDAAGPAGGGFAMGLNSSGLYLGAAVAAATGAALLSLSGTPAIGLAAGTMSALGLAIVTVPMMSRRARRSGTADALPGRASPLVDADREAPPAGG